MAILRLESVSTNYNALTDIARDHGPWQLVYCWTHVRRRFVKRCESDGSTIAEEMLRQIALLYQIKKTVRDKEAAVRLTARREHSAPIIAALKPWLEAQLSRIPQKSQLAEDIRYTLAHWLGLIRFLDDSTLELDTNPVENQIRPIALTRKNALFAGNDEGALYYTSTYASVISWLFEVDRQTPGVFRGVHRLLFERCLSQRHPA